MKRTIRALKWVARRRRRLTLLFGLTVGLVLLAHPGALADDVFGNISPAPQLPPGGWVGRYPVERYSLDQYFSAISVGFTSGVDASGVAPMIAYFGAQVLWLITCFLANGVILLFGLAFNLNLVTGNGSTGSGALTPVSQAIHSMYASTFGTPWLIAMVTLVGCWAMWKALVQRQYTETAGALAVSFLFFLLAIGIVTQPERTIGPASQLSNQLSTALLSLTNEGSVGNEEKAKTSTSNQLFELLVLNPWTVLEFGGIEHCAKVEHGKARSVTVRPLSSNPATDTQLASQLEHGTEVHAEGKTCINNRGKYATHFLQYPFQSHSRNSEHEALEHGDNEDLPSSDSGKTSGTYPLGPADEPSAESMGKGGQYERLLLAIVILVGEVGAYLLLGALALGVILAQILLLTLLAFAPVALLIGIFPGRGHDFFRNWLTKLASYLARKVVYSLILAVVLAVCQALSDATSNLGWLLAFALQSAFLWTVFIQRNRLTQDLMAGTVGPRAARDGTNRLANLYYATRLARLVPSLPSIPRRSGGGGGSSPGGGAPGGGAGTPSGGSPSGEEEMPPAGSGGPGPHETPTHGSGSPTPEAAPAPTAPSGEHERPHDAREHSEPEHDHPATAQAPPAPSASPHAQRVPGEVEDDELDAEHEPRPRDTATEAPAQGASPARARPAPAPASTSPVSSAPARESSATSPLPVRQTTAPEPMPSPPRTPAPAPPPPPPPSAELSASPPSGGATATPTAAPAEPAPIAPAVPGEEPVALLMRARQETAPSDPATQEEDLV